MKRRSGGSSASYLIDPVFKTLNVGVGHRGLGHPFRNFFGRVRQAGADGEQILLQLLDQPP